MANEHNNIDHSAAGIKYDIDGGIISYKEFYAKLRPKHKYVFDYLINPSKYFGILIFHEYEDSCYLGFSPDVGKGYGLTLYLKGRRQKDYYSLEVNYTHDFMDPKNRKKFL